MPGPQPVAADEGYVPDAVQPSPLLQTSGGEGRRPRFQVGDYGLRSGGLGCARPDRLRTGVQFQAVLARIWLQVLRRQRLGSSQRAVRRFTFHLRHAGFIAVSVCHRGAPVGRRRGLHDRDVSQGVARAAVVLRGIAGRDSQRDLRIVGAIRPRSSFEPLRAALPGKNPGLDRPLRRPALRDRHARCRESFWRS